MFSCFKKPKCFRRRRVWTPPREPPADNCGGFPVTCRADEMQSARKKSNSTTPLPSLREGHHDATRTPSGGLEDKRGGSELAAADVAPHGQRPNRSARTPTAARDGETVPLPEEQFVNTGESIEDELLRGVSIELRDFLRRGINDEMPCIAEESYIPLEDFGYADKCVGTDDMTEHPADQNGNMSMRREYVPRAMSDLELHYREFLGHSRGTERSGDDEKGNVSVQQCLAARPSSPTTANTTISSNQHSCPPPQTQRGSVDQGQVSDRNQDQEKQEAWLLRELPTLQRQIEECEAQVVQKASCHPDQGDFYRLSVRIQEFEDIQNQYKSIADALNWQKDCLRNLKGTENYIYFLSEISVLFQKLENLNRVSAGYLDSLRTLRTLLKSILQITDVIHTTQANLMGEDVLSLDLEKVKAYLAKLKKMKADFSMKQSLLGSMETGLQKILQIFSESPQAPAFLNLDPGKLRERAEQLTRSWRWVEKLLDDRTWVLDRAVEQLRKHHSLYQSLHSWICDVRCRQEAMEAMNIGDCRDTVRQYWEEQKTLRDEITSKRDKVEELVEAAKACSFVIEATEIQSQYIELLTRSEDYYKTLSKTLNDLRETLKMKNAKIEELEEKLTLAKNDASKNNKRQKCLEEDLLKSQKYISLLKADLLHMKERQTGVEDQYFAQIEELKNVVTRLMCKNEEEMSKRKWVEDRCKQQKSKLDQLQKARQEEVETLGQQKTKYEKTIKEQEHEIATLRTFLRDEGKKKREYENKLAEARRQLNKEVKYEQAMLEKTTLQEVKKITVQRLSLRAAESWEEGDAQDFRVQIYRLQTENTALKEENIQLRDTISKTNEQRKRVKKNAI